ncbi:MAG: hypothetical protein K2H38_07670 [Muribaculaceae bacterium]|nr:hypothetical protein [Muribaculaceae bacterium]MDE6551461.1 hypothetical protein [Muribaculaceae bacterium]
MKSNYFSLWLLLVLGLAIVVGISFMPHDVSVGAYALKKAPIKSTLTQKVAAEDTVAALAEVVVAVDEKPKAVETDTLPKSIFIFGDSMSFNLALRLAAYAAQNGHTIHSINWDSSSTKKWADSDTLKYFLDKYNVDYVFIALGSNEMYTKNADAHVPHVKKLLETIGDRPYVWIGPPDLKGNTGKFEEMLAATCRPGSFFKSTGIEMKRRGDRIHPTKEASALWVDSMARWMPKSSHPILMNMPSDSIRKVNANIISWSSKKK